MTEWKTVDKNGKKLTEPQLMYNAVIVVCGLDEDLVPRGRYGPLSAQLIDAGYTVEDIRAVYDKGGWWYQNHHLGKKGQYPNEYFIRQTIKQGVEETRGASAHEEDGGVYF